MKSMLLNAGTMVWNITPFKGLKELYFRLFLRAVRGTKKIASVEGMTFDLDLGEMIDVCLYLQRFERDVAAVIEKVCRPGSVVVDIGANIGAHALRFAREAGPQGRVLAFEPTDFAYKKLVRNIALNQYTNLEAFQVALSDQNLPQQEISWRSSWRTDGSRDQSPTVVDFIRLDDWLMDHQVSRIDIVKIDVDGNEYPVFAGSRNMLENYRPLIIMEVGAWHFHDSDRNPLMLLEGLGYRFWDAKTLKEYEGLRDIRGQLPEADIGMSYSINVIAATKEPDGAD